MKGVGGAAGLRAAQKILKRSSNDTKGQTKKRDDPIVCIPFWISFTHSLFAPQLTATCETTSTVEYYYRSLLRDYGTKEVEVDERL